MEMICVEGYKAFRGKMKITPFSVTDQGPPPFILEGDWLYKPETDCWYGCGRSFCAGICTPVTE